MPRLCRFLTLLLLAVLPLSCADDAQDEYARLRAYFHYDRVLAALPLYQSLTSMGQFCAIYVDRGKLIFRSLTSEQRVDLAAVAYYQSFITLGGFLVGRPDMPDAISGRLDPVAYDRACSNCYEEDGVCKTLELREMGRAYCPRCHRLYNLSDRGLVIEGDKGLHLYRYRLSYNGTNVLHIQNR